jgi:ABC-type lipoprotein export system ATPase subunit
MNPRDHQRGGQALPPDASTVEYSFARFWRCALQVNPYSYQTTYRGKDHGLDEDGYNRALLAKCQQLEIDVVGIADHGSVVSLDKLRETLRAGGIVVFPGFEIASTEKIHMVCLFSEDTSRDQLNRHLGMLGAGDGSAVAPSSFGCLELAKKIHEIGGFWYAAHVTGSNGLLRLYQDGGGLVHVWRDDSCVRVAQIPGPVSSLEEKYRDIVENRDAAYHRDRLITVINARDVTCPEDLAHAGASSWVKMTRPSFEAFKVAFLDPESRIRLSLASEPHGVLESMRIHGGYLDGLQAHFSDHLNALIGGRGTGKSTLVECLRYALELPPKGKQALKLHQDIVRENLGRYAGSVELTVRSAAHHGRRFAISRRFGEPPIVRLESGAVSQQTPRDLLPQIEVYGQNEIFELAQDGPSRVRLLERFLPPDHSGAEQLDLFRRKLADNAQRLVKARTELDELAERVGRLPRLGEQLKGFQELGIEAKLAKTPLFARERQLVERVAQEIDRLARGIEGLGESLPDLTFLSDNALEGLPDASLLAAVRGVLNQLHDRVVQHQSAVREALVAGNAALAPRLNAWRAAMEAGERELEGALTSLPNMAGKTGREVGAAYRQLTQEIERIKPLGTKKESLEQLLRSLDQERASLIAELSDLRRARTTKLQAAVASLNQRLKGKLRVELRVEGDRGRLREFLAECRLEGVGEKRLAWVEDQDVAPLALARSVREGVERLAADFGITPVVAEALAKLPYSKVLELEAIELTDQVKIELNVAHGKAEQYKDLARLSTGQQCTAVLHLLLLANPDPLVVDQPEDNLDNAFIAERIVRELRDAKTRRQFLFSTHNANIPVFGDAEWIGVLTASEDHGRIEPGHQGSIDVTYIREQAAEILEGGRAAFTQRKEMYEF